MWGPPDPTGRGLRTLSQIMGRTRNLLVAPDGHRFWPVLGHYALSKTGLPIRQYQVVQHTPMEIELKTFALRPLSAEEKQQFKDHVLNSLQQPYNLSITYLDQPLKSAAGKFEDALCLIAN